VTHPTPDRRRFPRVQVGAPLRVGTTGGGPSREEFVAEVVGLGGLMFRSEMSFGRGTELLLDLALGDQRVEATGRVVYERITVVGDLEVGVEFGVVSPDGQDLLQELLRKSA